MKARNRPIRAEEHAGRENERVRQQIRGFLAALHSYPQRFAEDQSLSFEEHRRSLLEEVMPSARRRD